MRGFVPFLGMGARIFREIWAKWTFLPTWERNSKRRKLAYHFQSSFLKKDSLGFLIVCNIGGQLGTKVVISVLGMLALYMRFNGTGIWGGETKCSFTVTLKVPVKNHVIGAANYW